MLRTFFCGLGQRHAKACSRWNLCAWVACPSFRSTHYISLHKQQKPQMRLGGSEAQPQYFQPVALAVYFAPLRSSLFTHSTLTQFDILHPASGFVMPLAARALAQSGVPSSFANSHKKKCLHAFRGT